MGKINKAVVKNPRVSFPGFEKLRRLGAQHLLQASANYSGNSTYSMLKYLDTTRLSPVSGMAMMDKEEVEKIRNIVRSTLDDKAKIEFVFPDTDSMLEFPEESKENNHSAQNRENLFKPIEKKPLSEKEKHRQEALERFKAKPPMKQRFYGTKMRYKVRFDFATSRPRVKGRFVAKDVNDSLIPSLKVSQ